MKKPKSVISQTRKTVEESLKQPERPVSLSSQTGNYKAYLEMYLSYGYVITYTGKTGVTLEYMHEDDFEL